MAEIKDRIILLRQKRQMNQKELADKLGISASTIGMIEQGRRKPSFELLEEIADYFNVDMDYLTGRSDIPNRHQAGLEYKWETKANDIDIKKNESSVKLGQILKTLRINKNLTLEQLADVFIQKYSTGTTKSLISKWEKNIIIPTNQSLQMYCDYFNVSMDYLMGNTDIPQIVKEDDKEKSTEDIISTLTEAQQTELNFLVKQYATMLMASVNSATEKDKKELIRVVIVAYLKSIGKIKEV